MLEKTPEAIALQKMEIAKVKADIKETKKQIAKMTEEDMARIAKAIAKNRFDTANHIYETLVQHA